MPKPKTPQTIRCSFLPIAEKCQAACYGEEDPQIHFTIPEGTVGTALHELAALMTLTNRPPTTEIVQKTGTQYGVDLDDLTGLIVQAWQWWKSESDIDTEGGHGEVHMNGKLGPLELTGSTDWLKWDGEDTTLLLDWKTGFRTEVDVEAQMKGYAWASAQASRQRVDHDIFAQTVTAIVVWLRDQTTQTWKWEYEDLDAWAAALGKQIVEWDSKYEVGDHCRYCPRLFTCPAQKAIVHATVSSLRETHDHMALPELTGQMVSHMASVYARMQHVEQLCKAFRDAARRAVQQFGPIATADGRELVLTTSERETISAYDGWEILGDYMDDDGLDACMKVNKTKMLKEVASRANKGGKGKAQAKVMLELREAGAVKTTTVETLRLRNVRKELTDA